MPCFCRTSPSNSICWERVGYFVGRARLGSTPSPVLYAPVGQLVAADQGAAHLPVQIGVNDLDYFSVPLQPRLLELLLELLLLLCRPAGRLAVAVTSVRPPES